MKGSLKIAVFLGGTSAERDVSIVSGYYMARAIESLGHEVHAFDVAHGSRLFDFHIPEDEIRILPVPANKSSLKALEKNIIHVVQHVLKEGFDLVIIGLHGGYGENGQLQALLELAGIPFTGSGSLSSALAMDKILTKIVAEKFRIPTADYLIVEKGNRDALEMFTVKKGKVVVKPADEGSTVGLTIVESKTQLPTAISVARQYSDRILVEEYIPGRELTVSILEDQALPVIEIRPKSGFYDYQSKYQKGMTEYLCPAPLETSIAEKIQKSAEEIFSRLGCRHYGRVDFRLHENGRDYYLLEVNTLPGMTPTSLVPKAARAAGIGFEELMERLITMAMKQRRENDGIDGI